MNTVACVLRSGGEYAPRHVVRLLDQVTEHLPGAKFSCFSDVDVQGVEVIRHEWPGWWAKMELFRPELPGDWLYFDLDTTIVGSLADIAAVEGPVIMRDVVEPWRFGSGIMAVPQSIKAAVWEAFTAAPADHMRRFAFDGDQAFLETCRGVDWRLWQDLCPGQLCSYKVDVSASAASRRRSRSGFPRQAPAMGGRLVKPVERRGNAIIRRLPLAKVPMQISRGSTRPARNSASRLHKHVTFDERQLISDGYGERRWLRALSTLPSCLVAHGYRSR